MCTTEEDPTGGITVERRALLSLPLVAFAPGAVLRPPRPGERADDERLSFEAFTRAWKEASAELLPGAAARDDVYLGRLLAQFARLDVSELPDFVRRNESETMVAGPIWFEASVALIRFELQPGAVIRPHDHPPSVVMTTGIAGECTFRHFESVGEKPAHDSEASFRVQETRRGILSAGRTTALTRAKDWMHTFRAGAQGATIVDFSCTLPGDPQDWSYAAVQDEPVDAERALYEAVWEPR